MFKAIKSTLVFIYWDINFNELVNVSDIDR